MPQDERLFMKMEVLKAETMSKTNGLFRDKVQLEEQVRDNETQIHFNRGVLETLGFVQKTITDMNEEDRGDAVRIKKMEEATKKIADASKGAAEQAPCVAEPVQCQSPSAQPSITMPGLTNTVILPVPPPVFGEAA